MGRHSAGQRDEGGTPPGGAPQFRGRERRPWIARHQVLTVIGSSVVAAIVVIDVAGAALGGGQTGGRPSGAATPAAAGSGSAASAGTAAAAQAAFPGPSPSSRSRRLRRPRRRPPHRRPPGAGPQGLRSCARARRLKFRLGPGAAAGKHGIDGIGSNGLGRRCPRCARRPHDDRECPDNGGLVRQ